MALDEQLRQLADQVPPLPPGDATTAFRRGTQRRRIRQVVGGAAAVSAVAVLGVGVVSLLDTQPRLPEVADQPEQLEVDDDEAEQLGADGWVELQAGELEVSVPQDWQVHTVQPAPDPDAQAGPCASDLYGGIANSISELTAPLAVVYSMETTGMCRAIGLPDHPPGQSSIVLYAGIASGRGTDAPPHGASEERIGSVDMWRLDSEPHEHFAEFQRRDGQGGLLVSHLDDPVVQQVLKTLRTTEITADGQRDEVSEQRVGDDGLRFFVHGHTVEPGGEGALVGGALAAADGCVLLENGGSRFPVVWPNGTSVVGTDPLMIELPSGEQVHLGDEIQGGGGYHDVGSLGIDVPDECLNEYSEVAVFNSDDDPAANPG